MLRTASQLLCLEAELHGTLVHILEVDKHKGL